MLFRSYIGEAENVYGRLVQHISEKEFWNEAVVFISKDENLNKAHIKYLESRLFELASDAGRYEIQNGNRPTRSSISESDQAEMEEFIEYVRMLVNTLNFKVFEPLVKESTSLEADSEELYLKGARGAAGRGKRVVDGFVVFKGSEAASSTVPSFPKGFRSLRDELIENEVIKEEQGLNELPIITGMDFGHTCPTFTIPYGILGQIDCDSRTFSIVENALND